MLCPLFSGLFDLNRMKEGNSSILQDGAIIFLPLYCDGMTHIIVPVGQGFSVSALVTFWNR